MAKLKRPSGLPEGQWAGKLIPVGVSGGRIRPRRLVVAMDLPKMQNIFIHEGTPVKAEVVGGVLVVTFEV
jgi:hypothetical protein